MHSGNNLSKYFKKFVFIFHGIAEIYLVEKFFNFGQTARFLPTYLNKDDENSVARFINSTDGKI